MTNTPIFQLVMYNSLSRMQTGLCLGIDFVHVWSAYTFLCENLLIGYIAIHVACCKNAILYSYSLGECLLVSVIPKREYTKSLRHSCVH